MLRSLDSIRILHLKFWGYFGGALIVSFLCACQYPNLELLTKYT